MLGAQLKEPLPERSRIFEREEVVVLVFAHTCRFSQGQVGSNRTDRTDVSTGVTVGRAERDRDEAAIRNARAAFHELHGAELDLSYSTVSAASNKDRRSTHPKVRTGVAGGVPCCASGQFRGTAVYRRPGERETLDNRAAERQRNSGKKA